MNDEKEIGRTILGGKYQITAEIGRGGMGVVYKGIQTSLGRPVAIKVLPAQFARDREFVNRFRREAEALGRLNHPNIVTIHDLDSEGEEYFLVMEYVDGRDLSSTLEPGRTVPPYLAVTIAIQTAEALAAAHRCGIVHRDVKPQNILVEEITGRVKVADFGVAAMSDATSLTRTGSVIGTPKYMSPEQIQGMPVTGASDIYSLGAVLYELLAGRAPFVGDTAMAIAYQHVDGTPPPLGSLAPGLPAGLVKIVERALQKQPERRFASASEMAQALRAVPIKEGSDRARHGTSSNRRRRVRYAVLTGVAAVVGLAALFFGQTLLTRTRPPSVAVNSTALPNVAARPAPARADSQTASPAVSAAVGADPRTTRPTPVVPAATKPGNATNTQAAASKGDAPKEITASTGAPAIEPAPTGAASSPPAAVPSPGPAQTPQPDHSVYDRAQRSFDAGDFTSALASFRSYLVTAPDPAIAADAQHGIAESLYNLGNFAAAVPEYRKILDGYPASEWVDDSAYAIGWCYEKQKDYANAVRSYQVFLEKFPDSAVAAKARYRIARCLFDQSDYAAALPAYEKVVQDFPRSQFGDLSQFAIGECYYRQGDYARAAGEYAKVVLEYPASQWADDAQLSVGWSYYKQKDFARAASEFARVEQNYPQSDQIPAALLQIARCHLAQGDRSAAGTELREVVRRFPGSKSAGEAQETLATLK